MKYFNVAIVLTILLSGCASNPYTGEEETSQTAKTAGKGALIGAIIGAVSSNDHGKGARNGALAGAALGAGAGMYMDKQNRKLLAELEATGVRVIKTGHQITLVMPGDIGFDSASFDIKASFYPVLNAITKVLIEYNQTTIKVTGHTDNVGSEIDNQTLSEARASSVATYFKAQGIDQARLHSQGRGERLPVSDNSTDQGRAKNRRVEIQLIAIEPTKKRRFRRS